METSHHSDTQLRQIARFFYALKDPRRLRILITLAQAGEMTVTELAKNIRISQPLVSWHLGQLRTAGLVNVERSGRIARYSIVLESIEEQLMAFRTLLLASAGEETA
ncbi:MAG: helix-turn-helix transcriptional regulator [Anaerolineae bacterium]|nr:helix-turn-helix transcriptional regulator [Anaerolineae bacterium]